MRLGEHSKSEWPITQPGTPIHATPTHRNCMLVDPMFPRGSWPALRPYTLMREIILSGFGTAAIMDGKEAR